MKATTCSKLSNVQRNWVNREKRLVEKIDRYKCSGESSTDDNYINNHMTVNAEGDRCWSF